MKYRVRLLGPYANISGNLGTRAFIAGLLRFQNGVSDPFDVNDSNEQIRGRLAYLRDELARAYGARNFEIMQEPAPQPAPTPEKSRRRSRR